MHATFKFQNVFVLVLLPHTNRIHNDTSSLSPDDDDDHELLFRYYQQSRSKSILFYSSLFPFIFLEGFLCFVVCSKLSIFNAKCCTVLLLTARQKVASTCLCHISLFIPISTHQTKKIIQEHQTHLAKKDSPWSSCLQVKLPHTSIVPKYIYFLLLCQTWSWHRSKHTCSQAVGTRFHHRVTFCLCLPLSLTHSSVSISERSTYTHIQRSHLIIIILPFRLILTFDEIKSILSAFYLVLSSSNVDTMEFFSWFPIRSWLCVAF